MARQFGSVVLLAAAVLLARCESSEDRFSCPSGQERCGGSCTDPATYATDPASCGACGVSCGAGGTCADGGCVCAASLTLCDQSNPRCVDLLADRQNCGACGARCPHTNDVCVDGLRCACPSGLATPCGSTCVDLATDESHCGTCSTACATGQTCTGGECLCPGTQVVCGGACTDTQTDEANCGACGKSCATGATCTNKSCACPAGPVAGCGGTCCAGGSTCCGTACPTEHSNGLGQHFYDCAPLNTYNATQAESAARAWRPSGTAYPAALQCSADCVGWEMPAGTTPASCATWCWSGPLAGRVTVVTSLVCLCPYADYATWN